MLSNVDDVVISNSYRLDVKGVGDWVTKCLGMYSYVYATGHI